MDLKQEIRSFTPIDIEKLSQEKNVSEKVIDSVKGYNKAIENLRTGSEDIAMIELKKVISVNPDFYDAVNLLGLCYAYTNQIDKAQELFGRVADAEGNSVKATEYLNYIGRGSTSGKGSGNIKTVKTEVNPQKPVQKNRSAKPKKPSNEEVQAEYVLIKNLGSHLKKPSVAVTINILSVICLIAAIAVFMSNYKNTSRNESGPDTTVNTELNEKYDMVVSQNEKLKKDLDAANLKLKQIQLSSQLSQVSGLYGQYKYIEAADKLLAIPAKDLSADSKKKYDSIKANVLKNAANQLTVEGTGLFNKKKYKEAIQKLEKVFTYGAKWSFGDKALYVLGKSYVANNEPQKGAETYKKLIKDYPDSSYVKYARSRLESLQ
ncbi:tetratricopeptide repeat protein [Clostridium sp. BNL1100]|uniref:tetratricopeptide repeat protein n=1 Tax=Clostridium sp. BNL1100 TaxID=755731 RepID=UPI00024A724F|nr:tetratricopeptide repeat protein [Clostridium sp. BNL1100]AEY65471.1 hypothetical protein Clo1100_1223 [Clostridium sp. BNL1100]